MRVFIICPVRGGTPPEVLAHVARLEAEGCTVHLPPRDTDQVDDIGYRICCDNRAALAQADEVHVWYAADSQGGHFDCGMAFALAKPVVLLNDTRLDGSVGKSFPNMLREWERRQ